MEYRKPQPNEGGWAAGSDQPSAEECLAIAKRYRDELALVDSELRVLEEEHARVVGRLKGLKQRREEVRKAGENAFAQIALAVQQGR